MTNNSTQASTFTSCKHLFVCVLQMNMMMLAEHIMEATPDRIKQEGFVATETETSPPETVGVSGDVSWLASYIGDVER